MDVTKKVTLKSIAKIMGMSPAAISKALRDSSDISIETRKKAKELAANLGYRPNLMARNLVIRRTFMLGVIIPDLRISFYSEVTRGIYEQARSRGYVPIILVHDEKAENEKLYLEFLSSLHVDGIIICAVDDTKNIDLLRSLSDQGMPFVCFDRRLYEPDFSSITIDDEKAAFHVIEEFVKAGRKQILYIGPTDSPYVIRERYKGCCNGLKHFGIEHNPQLVATCGLDTESAEQEMKKVIQSGVKFDAVMGVGGLVAYGAGIAMLKEGISIPDEVILAEFGNNNIISRLGVPIISVYQSPYEMGTKTVEMVVNNLEDKENTAKTEHVIIDFKLIYRGIGVDFFRNIGLE